MSSRRTWIVQWLRATTMLQRIVLASVILGAALFIRIVASADLTLAFAVSMLGLSAAWAANVAAAVLLVVIGAPWVVGRKGGLDGSVAAPLYFMLGGGWLLAGLGGLLAGFADWPGGWLVFGGLVGIGYAVWIRARETDSISDTVRWLAVVVFAFQVPRERGAYSVEWNSATTHVEWSSNGGENCSGMNLGDHPAAIAPYRPDYAIQSQLYGSLGELVNERLRPEPTHDPSRAEIVVTGDLDYRGVGCYVPLYRTLSVHGTVSTATTFDARFDGGSLGCSASHQLELDVDVTAVGFASCHDLASKAAQQIADQLHAHARAVCGY